jgi:hypothetical protein
VLCCLPAGVVSIVYAAKVNGLYESGQYAQAQEAAANAKRWAIISAVAAVAVTVVYLIFAVLMAAGGGGF